MDKINRRKKAFYVTSKIILIGGNGYIGRALTAAWAATDPSAQFDVLSRSGYNQLDLPQITNCAIDLNDQEAVSAAIPGQFDYIVDLVGKPEKDAVASIAVNDKPALLMKHLAETHHAKAMGFIGGRLGAKSFVTTKRTLIGQLQASSVPLAVVEPTLVYGAGRQDSMTKMVPLLKILGVVIPNMKPVKVDTVVDELLTKLLQY